MAQAVFASAGRGTTHPVAGRGCRRWGRGRGDSLRNPVRPTRPANSPATAADGFLVNGSTTDCTRPYATTYLRHAHRHRDAQIRVGHLVGTLEHVPDNRLWGIARP
ncbi:hypothetical protein [Streptomyces chiangmaiensis]|uniref:Uncharacterized protein n=1 Tax=Streptomyces chiangmaiensis TaxID=766497 RepID=A0ABU7FXD8_9ACTN|nr:hypothetical protein [Streptomyces chiangmaiensis]MED7828488.1 hypothetical protein [Streptomyces chiangmaiensis]